MSITKNYAQILPSQPDDGWSSSSSSIVISFKLSPFFSLSAFWLVGQNYGKWRLSLSGPRMVQDLHFDIKTEKGEESEREIEDRYFRTVYTLCEGENLQK